MTTILKGVPRILSPDLLRVLARMGHGDELVLADCNFPAASCAATTTHGIELRSERGIPELLKAVMSVLPLDPVAPSGIFMAMMPEHVAAGWKTPIWAEYKSVILAAEPTCKFEEVERFAFYERAKKAFAIVSTGETALYGNLILRKGVLGPGE